MKRYLIVLISLLIATLTFPQTGQTEFAYDISAEHAIVLDAETGRVLYEKNAHERRPIASITKVLTALIAIEYGNLNEKVSVSKQATLVEGSSIYLQENEKMSLKDLLYGLMLRSGNDAAIAIAEHVGGSVEGFTYLMNEKAAYLGMSDSQFKNPHGLDEEGHYASAYDIAILMRYAMENETFRSIAGTKSYLSKNRNYKWFNKNKLLTSLYPHCTGGKTGFTKKAGRTLVTTAEKDGHSLIIVTLNAPSDWQDHIRLYDDYFDQLERILLDKKGLFISDDKFPINFIGRIDEDVYLSIMREERPLLRKHIFIKEKETNKKAVEVHYLLNDTLIYKTTIDTYENKLQLYLDEMLHVFFDVIGTNRHG